MTVTLLTEHNLEFLSLKGGCTGSSESTLVKMPHCWKSHVTAHISFLFQTWQWNVGTVSIFLCWINLVLFIQKFPRFGIYVVMFKDIMKTFFQFFIVFALFIIAFALAFFSLFKNQVGLNRPEVIKLFSCSTQLSTEFQLLIKLKYRQMKKFLALG